MNFLKKEQLEFLKEGQYLKNGETIEQRFSDVVEKVREYESLYSDGLADRIKILLHKNILSLSTPALSNFGRKKEDDRNTMSLPVSCNIVTYDDSIESIYESHAQIAMLSKLGAGVGLDFTQVCQKGTKLSEGFYSNSKLDWIEDGVKTAQKVSQGSTRRGYAVPFLEITDNDFDELMDRVSKKNSNKTDPLATNTVGIVIPIGFWQTLKEKDRDNQRRWVRVLKARDEDGRVYILDQENCNKNNSPVYEKLGYGQYTTNICTEYIQPTFSDKTSACVLSSLNLVYWDIIKEDTQIIKDCFMFLDILNEEYIKLTKDVPFLHKARKAAIEKRDIGLGTLGFHELLQIKGYAFGDFYSKALNKSIYKTIRECGEDVTKELGERLGSPKLCKEAGLVRRNCSLMMIAPNKSTSFISGATSLGIEPFFSNIFIKAIAKIQYVFKNKHLEKVLETYGKNNNGVWENIMENLGSVQHLDFLTDVEKEVFKTFAEISPKDIIDLAADRQEFIDMGQSLNLVFRPNYKIKDLHEMHTYAFEKGIKTLYYAYPSAHAALEREGENWDTCVSCAD